MQHPINDVRSYNHYAERLEWQLEAQVFDFQVDTTWTLLRLRRISSQYRTVIVHRSKLEYPSLRQIPKQAFQEIPPENNCINDVGSPPTLPSLHLDWGRFQTQFQRWRFLCNRRLPLVPLVQAPGLDLRKSGTAKSQWFYSLIKHTTPWIQSYSLGSQICDSYNLCEVTFSWQWYPYGLGELRAMPNRMTRPATT